MSSYRENYKKYRGKCKEMCEELINKDSTLTIVRGHYYEPSWARDEPHWWCVDANGNIVDPTKLQFPSGGLPELYTEFDGDIHCEECSKTFKEEHLVMAGNYPVCSELCAMKLVGLA